MQKKYDYSDPNNYRWQKPKGDTTEWNANRVMLAWAYKTPRGIVILFSDFTEISERSACIAINCHPKDWVSSPDNVQIVTDNELGTIPEDVIHRAIHQANRNNKSILSICLLPMPFETSRCIG